MRLKFTSEKEGSKYGGRYNRTAVFYCNVRLYNGKILLKRTFFAVSVKGSTTRPITVKNLTVTSLLFFLTPSLITVYIFAFFIPFFLFSFFAHNNDHCQVQNIS